MKRQILQVTWSLHKVFSIKFQWPQVGKIEVVTFWIWGNSIRKKKKHTRISFFGFQGFLVSLCQKASLFSFLFYFIFIFLFFNFFFPTLTSGFPERLLNNFQAISTWLKPQTEQSSEVRLKCGSWFPKKRSKPTNQATGQNEEIWGREEEHRTKEWGQPAQMEEFS